MIINYKQIRDVVKSFSDSHYMIKRFYSDYEDQLSTYSTSDESFPLLYMVPISGNMGYTQNKIDIRFYCVDRVIRDRTNWDDVINNCHRCLVDLYKFLQSGQIELIDTTSEPSITPVNDALMDYVSGWYMDITISLDTYSDCFIMIDGTPHFEFSGDIDFIKYLTCNTLNECPTIINIENNYFPKSGGVLTGPVVLSESVITATTSATTVDMSLSSNYEIMLEADTELTFTNFTSGLQVSIAIIQDATGGWTLTLPSVYWTDGSIPTQTADANAIDIYTFININNKIYGSTIQNFSL